MSAFVARNFLNSLVGSRLVDLYLKTTGARVLDSATMVPLAILLGRHAFKTFLQVPDDYQEGGGLLEDLQIPLFDDPFIGTYLTLLGVSQLTPETLLPVGIIATIYELYLKDLGTG